MFWITVLIIAFTIVSSAMILIILVQRPQGGGLSGAFGGAGGGSDTVFGGRTGDALTVATVVSFVLFLLLAIGLNLVELPRPNTANTTSNTTEQVPIDADTVDLGGPITIESDGGVAPEVAPITPGQFNPTPSESTTGASGSSGADQPE